MSKDTYLGIGGSPRRIKEMYIGINGSPRKVKEVYLGVSGVPKLVYASAFDYSYSGTSQFYGSKEGNWVLVILGGGTLTINSIPTNVDIFCVGGGGGGGYGGTQGWSSQGGGGGGGGGITTKYNASVTSGSYSVSIGAGGSAGSNGGTSQIAGIISAAGGGAGGDGDDGTSGGAAGVAGTGGGNGGKGTYIDTNAVYSSCDMGAQGVYPFGALSNEASGYTNLAYSAGGSGGCAVTQSPYVNGWYGERNSGVNATGAADDGGAGGGRNTEGESPSLSYSASGGGGGGTGCSGGSGSAGIIIIRNAR